MLQSHTVIPQDRVSGTAYFYLGDSESNELTPYARDVFKWGGEACVGLGIPRTWRFQLYCTPDYTA